MDVFGTMTESGLEPIAVVLKSVSGYDRSRGGKGQAAGRKQGAGSSETTAESSSNQQAASGKL